MRNIHAEVAEVIADTLDEISCMLQGRVTTGTTFDENGEGSFIVASLERWADRQYPFHRELR